MKLAKASEQAQSDCLDLAGLLSCALHPRNFEMPCWPDWHERASEYLDLDDPDQVREFLEVVRAKSEYIMLVAFGFQTLVANACDPDAETLEWKCGIIDTTADCFDAPPSMVAGWAHIYRAALQSIRAVKTRADTEKEQSEPRKKPTRPVFDNADALLRYYGYDSGSVLERIDRVCAGLRDASEEIAAVDRQLAACSKLAGQALCIGPDSVELAKVANQYMEAERPNNETGAKAE